MKFDREFYKIELKNEQAVEGLHYRILDLLVYLLSPSSSEFREESLIRMLRGWSWIRGCDIFADAIKN